MRRPDLSLVACLALFAGCEDAPKSEAESSNETPSQTPDSPTGNKEELSGKCDATQLTALVGAIDAAEPSARGKLVAEKFSDACEAPTAVAAFFRLLSEDLGESRPLNADTGAEIHTALATICSGYAVIKQQLAEVEGNKRGGILYDRCDFGRFGVIDREAWITGQYATGFPLYAYQWLLDQGATETQAKAITRAMLKYEERKWAASGQTLAKVTGSLATIPDSPAIYVTPRDIRLDAKRVTLLDEDGKIDPSVHEGHLIGPLFDGLVEEAIDAKQMADAAGEQEWDGQAVVVADASTPFGTLVDIMYSAERAEYSTYAFVVQNAEGEGAISISPPKVLGDGEPPPAPSMVITVGQEGFSIHAAKHDEPTTKIAKAGEDYDYAALGNAADDFTKKNDKSTRAWISADAEVPFSVLAQTLIALRGPDCDSGKDCLLPDLVIEAGSGAGGSDPAMSGRKAGILGTLRADSDDVPGNDEDDLWGGLTDDGKAPGSGGLGLVGTGRGGGGTKVPRVRQAKATVKGSLDKDIIRRIVRSHVNEVRYCYEKGLSKDPKLEGRVSVTFTISATGKVTNSEVASESLSDDNVGTCIAKAVKRWKFPKPTGGGIDVVTYPFVLAPS